MNTLLNNYPNTFTVVQIHIGDAYSTTWGNNRDSFYGVSGTPDAYFDGTIERSGTYTSDAEAYAYYLSAYNARKSVPTDVTISVTGDPVAGQTYRISARVCLEAGGTGKTVRVYMAQVLDLWPAPGSPPHHRNGLKQGATTEDVALSPGGCQTIVRDFTFDADSWASQSNIRIIVWAQEPQASGGSTDRAEIFQAAAMPWPFPSSDCNSNGIPDGEEMEALITTDPVAVALCPGGTATFTVAASQPGVTYQWKKGGSDLSDGGDISGATTDTLTIANVDATDAGNYTCEVADGCIVAESKAAALTVKTAPSITGQPQTSLNTCAGNDASFSVTAAGTAPFTYVWRKNGTPVGAPSSATLVLTAVDYDDEGSYTCLVSNDCGSALSNAGVLNVVGPMFTIHPQDSCGPVGSTIVLTASATADSTIYWAWRKNGSIVSGAATNTLTLKNVQPSDAGQYKAVAATYSPITCVRDSAIAVVSVPCPCPVPGDMDDDGDFDLADMSGFTLCFGPGEGLAPECVCANVNEDSSGNVDLTDWTALVQLIAGPLP